MLSAVGGLRAKCRSDMPAASGKVGVVPDKVIDAHAGITARIGRTVQHGPAHAIPRAPAQKDK